MADVVGCRRDRLLSDIAADNARCVRRRISTLSYVREKQSSDKTSILSVVHFIFSAFLCNYEQWWQRKLGFSEHTHTHTYTYMSATAFLSFSRPFHPAFHGDTTKKVESVWNESCRSLGGTPVTSVCLRICILMNTRCNEARFGLLRILTNGDQMN